MPYSKFIHEHFTLNHIKSEMRKILTTYYILEAIFFSSFAHILWDWFDFQLMQDVLSKLEVKILENEIIVK